MTAKIANALANERLNKAIDWTVLVTGAASLLIAVTMTLANVANVEISMGDARPAPAEAHQQI